SKLRFGGMIWQLPRCHPLRLARREGVLDSPPGKLVEHGHFLGEPEWVIERELPDHATKAQLARAAGHCGEEDGRGRAAPDGRVLVLDYEVRVPAQLFNALRHLKVLLIDICGTGCPLAV